MRREESERHWRELRESDEKVFRGDKSFCCETVRVGSETPFIRCVSSVVIQGGFEYSLNRS